MTTEEFEHEAGLLRPMLVATAARMLGSDSRAEDAAQETLAKLWMMRGNISLPAPLSPVMSTVKSVGATCTAFSMALSSLTSLPMISKRCLMLLMSSMSREFLSRENTAFATQR